MSEYPDNRKKNIKMRLKELYFDKKKNPVQQADITIINIYAVNTKLHSYK